MTLPLLGVYLYFLRLAIDRKNIADPNYPRYAEDRIHLTDMLVLFSSLAVYLLWFVAKRRNVEYEAKIWDLDSGFCGNVAAFIKNSFMANNNYGRVAYDPERVANHPACNYEAQKGRELTGTVTKKVRVYYCYPRERVSLLILPDRPRSGQPKIDIEADWASFSNHVGLTSEIGDSKRNESLQHAAIVLIPDQSEHAQVAVPVLVPAVLVLRTDELGVAPEFGDGAAVRVVEGRGRRERISERVLVGVFGKPVHSVVLYQDKFEGHGPGALRSDPLRLKPKSLEPTFLRLHQCARVVPVTS